MKLGVLITSVGNFGQKGFYNAQEIGLAKELDKLFDKIVVYKAIPQSEKKSESPIEGCECSVLYQIPVKANGINGIWDCRVMDTTLDALLYFSDTQLSVLKVYMWCCQNSIKMYPYVGVIESHSTNKLKKLLINVLFQRNVWVYKKCTCFVKTLKVSEQMNTLGIKNKMVTPVGLDLTLLRRDYDKTSASEIRKKYGYSETDKVLLFIGRLIEEKQPVRMIEILSEIRKKNQPYKLLMVGTGELKTAVDNRIKGLELSESVQMIERIPNSDIWELYRLADVFVNLNQQEIFGMAILEAMYYGCRVVAWEAPGPNMIIENGVSGWIVSNDEQVIEKIVNGEDVSVAAHERIVNKFTWESTAGQMYRIISEGGVKHS